ncbi:PTS transporter subunit EIIC [Paenibacillus sp. chi10]|uniref:PTS transporter subunit EIIC n=1 Tax=Paenibacillus suaedae TaxID=3077233 RepID=A0AAJ2N1Y3_9BACL|nr:PTS transporter subunit EIIC [Paenibacillus sp. chi10]MDT8976888.1 PTS transporter subunit EIIC [Paenibacillus sp. chi10]
MKMMTYMQQIGRSLMIPIAVLPAASILVRIGDIKSSIPWVDAAASVCKLGGNAIFDHMPLFFAIGVAIGLTSGQGVAALAAAVGYFVFTNVMKHFENEIALDTGVLGGMLCGAIVAILYKRYHGIRLPAALGFFGGKRFIPIISSLVMVIVGVGAGLIWPAIQEAIRDTGTSIMTAKGWGAGLYGLLNRLLIPTGLHHILNNIAWFQIGEYVTDAGAIVRGDLWRFHAGDPTAGTFMAGFFPVMMFGLPAYALAIVRSSQLQERKRIASIMLTASLTSFLTGITEPLEFTLMLTAPVLYGIHALYTGLALMLADLMAIRAGFGFSAGFIDMFISWTSVKDTLLLLLLGVLYFGLYYATATIAIRMFHVHAPGREEDRASGATSPSPTARTQDDADALLERLLGYIGGMGNIRSVDACITRLRLQLEDESKVDEVGIMCLGAYGMMRVAKGHIHIVMGTDSELLREKIERRLSVSAFING